MVIYEPIYLFLGLYSSDMFPKSCVIQSFCALRRKDEVVDDVVRNGQFAVAERGQLIGLVNTVLTCPSFKNAC